MHRRYLLPTSTMWIYSEFISLPLSTSPHSNYKMLFCAGVPQRPCMKFIGLESLHLTRKTWLTDLAPFPISSGSRVKLTFPASKLYLNPEHQRLMAHGKFYYQRSPFDLIQAYCRLCPSMPYIYTLLRQTRAPETSPTIDTWAGVTTGEAFLWTALRSSHKIIGSIYSAHHLR